MMNSGYLYILKHPSKLNLIKIGATTLKIEKCLDKINGNYKSQAGQIVKETGQKWELLEYISVPDPTFAKKAFWSATPMVDFPLRGSDIIHMEKEEVNKCLNAAKKAGIRPPTKPRPKIEKDKNWLINQLEGTGIKLVGKYRWLIRKTDFECSKGHVFRMPPGRLVTHKLCPVCHPQFALWGDVADANESGQGGNEKA